MKNNDYKQFAMALYQTLEEVPQEKQTELLKNFVEFLNKKHCLKQADKIILEFEKFYKKQQGIKMLEISSANEVDKKIVEKIKNIFGKKVQVTKIIDKELLGGFMVRTEDKIFDSSIKKQIKTLKNKIN